MPRTSWAARSSCRGSPWQRWSRHRLLPRDGYVYVVDTARGLLVFNEP